LPNFCSKEDPALTTKRALDFLGDDTCPFPRKKDAAIAFLRRVLLSCFCNTAETKQQQRDDDDDDANIVLVRSRLSKRRKDRERRGTKGGTRLRNYFIQKRRKFGSPF
jgi:hypothetical protein